MFGFQNFDFFVVVRYFINQDVVVFVILYGKGFVGFVGLYLEVYELWCKLFFFII